MQRDASNPTLQKSATILNGWAPFSAFAASLIRTFATIVFMAESPNRSHATFDARRLFQEDFETGKNGFVGTRGVTPAAKVSPTGETASAHPDKGGGFQLSVTTPTYGGDNRV